MHVRADGDPFVSSSCFVVMFLLLLLASLASASHSPFHHRPRQMSSLSFANTSPSLTLVTLPSLSIPFTSPSPSLVSPPPTPNTPTTSPTPSSSSSLSSASPLTSSYVTPDISTASLTPSIASRPLRQLLQQHYHPLRLLQQHPQVLCSSSHMRLLPLRTLLLVPASQTRTFLRPPWSCILQSPQLPPPPPQGPLPRGA